MQAIERLEKLLLRMCARLNPGAPEASDPEQTPRDGITPRAVKTKHTYSLIATNRPHPPQQLKPWLTVTLERQQISSSSCGIHGLRGPTSISKSIDKACCCSLDPLPEAYRHILAYYGVALLN